MTPGDNNASFFFPVDGQHFPPLGWSEEIFASQLHCTCTSFLSQVHACCLNLGNCKENFLNQNVKYNCEESNEGVCLTCPFSLLWHAASHRNGAWFPCLWWHGSWCSSCCQPRLRWGTWAITLWLWYVETDY